MADIDEHVMGIGCGSESGLLRQAPFFEALDVRSDAFGHFIRLSIDYLPGLDEADELLEEVLSVPVLLVNGIMGAESLDEGPFAKLALHHEKPFYVSFGTVAEHLIECVLEEKPLRDAVLLPEEHGAAPCE